jgi:O-phosphoseryl-tRNA(Cys) synthetase
MRTKTGYSAMQVFRTFTAILLVNLLSLMYVNAQNTKGQAVMSTETAKATVTSINQKTREVTVKTEDGKEHSFVAGDHVKNLALVKKGDIITVTYTEALAYEVKKHDAAAGVSTTQAVASAKPGSKPAGVVAQQTTVTVKIIGIDPKVPTVTFMGPAGNTKTIVVKDPKKLDGVKVGDLVDITYTEAIAVEVDKPTKK